MICMNKNMWLGFLNLVLLLLIVLSLNESHEKVLESKKTFKDFEIIYNDTEMLEEKEELYRNDKYIYYLDCYSIDNVKIKINNYLYSLSSVINLNIISIDDLINHGLPVETYTILESEDDPKVDIPNVNDKPNIDNETLNENNKIILSYEQLKEYNKKIKSKADMVYDIDSIASLTREEVLNYINSYKLPTLPKYNGSEKLTNDNVQSILDNRNLDNVKDNNTILKGIVVKRANLRSFPTNISFYDKENIKDFDRLQETELLVNSPVIIIHESVDAEWYFVISPFYAGWVLKDNIALATNDDYNDFINPKNYGIITSPEIVINNVVLNMSVKISIENNKYILPIKADNDYVARLVVNIPSKDINNGYLPYTKENVIDLAQKYLGVKYSWGGKDEGVDCSSFVSNVYRTFGFMFPRNTSSQNKSVGKIISLSNKANNEKLNIINNTEPSLLFQSGHVMLYVGMENNKHYIIHASGSDGKVTKTILNNSTYLNKIDRVVVIK